MKKLLACMLCLFSTLVCADNREWTDEEKVLGYSLLALTFIDYAQTRYIASNPGFHENNPLLGSHPSLGHVNTHFMLGTGIGYLLFDNNDRYRKDLLMIGTGIETFLVINNAKHGIGLNLKWRI